VIERTLAIIKPDAMAAGDAAANIERIEDEGFEIVAQEEIQASKEQTEGFYAEHAGKPFFHGLTSFMASGPITIMVLEKENAIADWRKLMGATNPANAEEGTLRKQFGTSIDNNATHGSDSPASAAREIAFFFPELES